MTLCLQGQGYRVNRKRIVRLMRKMGLEGQSPGPSTSKPQPGHKVYPYLLRGFEVTSVNQVWSTDITYIPLRQGFMYLSAVMDWYSRYVLSWELSNTLCIGFCMRALERALRRGKPEIFNTDQGSQFASKEFTSRLESQSIRISMDGRGRALDNIFVERLWRSLKYECIYLNAYENVPELLEGLRCWFRFYNEERPRPPVPRWGRRRRRPRAPLRGRRPTGRLRHRTAVRPGRRGLGARGAHGHPPTGSARTAHSRRGVRGPGPGRARAERAHDPNGRTPAAEAPIYQFCT